MSTKYFFGLLGAACFLALLSIAALILFVRHSGFRQTVGHDKPAFEKFEARVEDGSFKPETLIRFTNSWFEAQKQDHQIIQMEETISDRLARRVLILGVLGLLAVVVQIWLIFSLKSQLRKP